MSAKNWAVCPRCRARRQQTAQRLWDAAANAYGVVPRGEYERLYNAAAAYALRELNDDRAANRTFREDYEITGADDGEVVINYSGWCTKCNLSLAIEHRHSLLVEEWPE